MLKINFELITNAADQLDNATFKALYSQHDIVYMSSKKYGKKHYSILFRMRKNADNPVASLLIFSLTY